MTHTREMELTNGSKTVLPDRFIALFFDDSHLSLEDARYARTGVAKFLDSLAPTDHVGLFTASHVHFRKAGGRNLDANVPETVAGRFDGQIEL
jgi:hypothetical protein